MIRRGAFVATVAVGLANPALAQDFGAASGGSTAHEAAQRVLPVSSAAIARYFVEAKGCDKAVPVSVAARGREGMGVPTLDVTSSCRAATNLHLTDGQDYNTCMQDEQQARNQIRKGWSSYSPAIRARCTGEATTGGSPSYVDLFECMDMAKDAAHLEATGNGLDMTTSTETTGSITGQGSEARESARIKQNARSVARTIRIPSESDLDHAQAIDPNILRGVCQGC
ncbi:hypothetical protein BB934_01990 [Microvirga ossetica]|uniref:Secreted protein n=1 Tax=Microvirga ossetica TaxID=1882682 RepID=A0A1B2EAY5_9HYPH|nr:hypothetical protein [Microvirga ossetica]ANY77140.1 hypothetical protein BB934_01990 [Microvirga ossetica]